MPPVTRENMLDIDHHLGNSLFGKLNFVLENECSTGSVVMRILRQLGVVVAAIAMIGGGFAGVRWWLDGRYMVSTDDAYVLAHNTTVASKISA